MESHNLCLVSLCTYMCWLLSLSIMFSRFTMLEHVAGLHVFTGKRYSMYGDATFCLPTHQLMDIWVVSTFLALTRNAAMSIHVQVFVWSRFDFSWVLLFILKAVKNFPELENYHFFLDIYKAFSAKGRKLALYLITTSHPSAI